MCNVCFHLRVTIVTSKIQIKTGVCQWRCGIGIWPAGMTSWGRCLLASLSCWNKVSTDGKHYRCLLHMRPQRSRIKIILFICLDCRFKLLGQEEGEYFSVPVPPDGEEGNEELRQKFEVKSTSLFSCIHTYFFYLYLSSLSDNILILIDILNSPESQDWPWH